MYAAGNPSLHAHNYIGLGRFLSVKYAYYRKSLLTRATENGRVVYIRVTKCRSYDSRDVRPSSRWMRISLMAQIGPLR
jgi:hypothetical protein